MRKTYNLDIAISFEVDESKGTPTRSGIESLVRTCLDALGDDLNDYQMEGNQGLNRAQTEKVHLRIPRPKPPTKDERKQQQQTEEDQREAAHQALREEMIREYGSDFEASAKFQQWRPTKSGKEYSDEEIIKTPIFFRLQDQITFTSQGRKVRMSPAHLIPMCRETLRQMWQEMQKQKRAKAKAKVS